MWTAFKQKTAFTLIELLVVIIIVGILAAVAVPSYFKSVERSRASELELLFGSVVQAQEMYKIKNGKKYSENWKALQHMPSQVVTGALYCSKSTNTDEQKVCGTEAVYQTVLVGSDAPDMDAAVVATRKNSKQYGEYQLYRFYEETPATVYCKADTKDGQELCIDFLDAEEYLPPLRNPPNMPRTVVKSEPCPGQVIARCRIDTYEDGGKTKVLYNADGSVYMRTEYDAETGKMITETTYYSNGKTVRVEYDLQTGRNTSMISLEPDGSRRWYSYDPVTGKQTGFMSYRVDGNVSRRDNYDSTTGKKINEINYNSDGNVTYRSEYDPVTGNQTEQIYYRPDGSVSHASKYDGVTGKQTEYRSYGQDGSIWPRYVYDPVTGKNTTGSAQYDKDGNLSLWMIDGGQTNYRPDGTVSQRFNGTNGGGGFAEHIAYNPDGSVAVHSCYSGSCKEPGYTVAPADSYRPASQYPPLAPLPLANHWGNASDYPNFCSAHPKEEGC